MQYDSQASQFAVTRATKLPFHNFSTPSSPHRAFGFSVIPCTGGPTHRMLSDARQPMPPKRSQVKPNQQSREQNTLHQTLSCIFYTFKNLNIHPTVSNFRHTSCFSTLHNYYFITTPRHKSRTTATTHKRTPEKKKHFGKQQQQLHLYL